VFLHKRLITASALQGFDVVHGILSVERRTNQTGTHQSFTNIRIRTKYEMGALTGSHANAVRDGTTTTTGAMTSYSSRNRRKPSFAGCSTQGKKGPDLCPSWLLFFGFLFRTLNMEILSVQAGNESNNGRVSLSSKGEDRRKGLKDATMMLMFLNL
jgi:hypothetical protein